MSYADLLKEWMGEDGDIVNRAFEQIADAIAIAAAVEQYESVSGENWITQRAAELRKGAK